MRLTPASRTLLRGPTVVTLLTIFAVAIHGYHPYAEDGGLYVAGVKKLLNPALYPAWTDFVTGHLRFSLFAPAVAELVRTSHLPLDVVLLLLYLASIWATLYAAWMLASRLTRLLQARIGSVALLACWLTLPIAGTSLVLMDPYVTARSLSTPLVILAIAWALDRKPIPRILYTASLTVAALLHPLMAAYGLAAVILVFCTNASSLPLRRYGPPFLLLVALVTATVIQVNAPAESPAYLEAVLSRSYWFVSNWTWYEQAGLVAPLLLLASSARRSDSPNFPALAGAVLWLGVIALAVSLFFAHQHSATHLVARLQPLRCFQPVYVVMILLLGAWIGEHILKAAVWRWAFVLAVLGGIMFAVQRSTFPNSAHIEWPWSYPTNPWEQAFLWVRTNTPVDAVFALDAHYITLGTREDAQCFRAIAERSALPDYSKDGGEASITPQLADAWRQGVDAQTNLEDESGSVRAAKLRPLGAGWIILQSSSMTSWTCPYANATVKVCRLPDR